MQTKPAFPGEPLTNSSGYPEIRFYLMNLLDTQKVPHDVYITFSEGAYILNCSRKTNYYQFYTPFMYKGYSIMITRNER